MKRLVAMLLCAALCLSAPALCRAGDFVTYTLPQGAEHSLAFEAAFAIPDGLQGLYQIMFSGNQRDETHLFRMKNGRALMSVSRAQKAAPVTAQELLKRWPDIASGISGEAQYVDDSDGCATIGSAFGYETLEIATTAVVGADASLKLDLNCVAFASGVTLTEIWVARPAQTAYLFDETALQELQSDMADIEALFASLAFADASAASPLPKPDVDFVTAPYQDPGGRFMVDVPAGSLILTKQSPQSDFDDLRAALIDKYGAGAGRFFDVNYADIQAEDATMIVLGDLSATAMIYYVNVPGYDGITVDQLLVTADATVTSLTEKFGYATCLQRDGRIDLSGQQHAWTSYWLRSEQTDIMLNLMCLSEGGDWLRETDVFVMMDEKDSKLQQTMLYTIVNSIQYLIPQN